MKVSKEIYEFQEQIQDNFNPERIKENEVKKLEQKDQQLQEKIEEQSQNKEKLNYDKWNLIEQQVENQEQLEQTKEKDFSKEQMANSMGCSQDHSKEIDIYNKTNAEKFERIFAMKNEGNLAYSAKDFQKAAYYYSQSLLIFHYLIPEDEKEEQKCNDVKKVCHVNLGYAYWRLNRHQDALKEINLALQIKSDDVKALLRRGEVYLSMGEFEKARADATQALQSGQDQKEGESLMSRIESREKQYKEKSNQQQTQMAKEIVEKPKAQTVRKPSPVKNHQDSQKIEELKQTLAKSMKTVEELKEKLGNPKKEKENQKSVEDRLHRIEKKLIKNKSKFEDIQMAIELFKTYGFQPRQFDELLEEMKAAKGFKMEQRPSHEVLKPGSINPIEKFQLIFIMIGINLLMMFVAYHSFLKQ